jgi:elongation factor Ts
MEITAKMVKDLRETSGAGMMDCKKALQEANGDMDKAIEVLREKGIAKSIKKESRIAAEGLANVYVKDNEAVILEVNSETDFVSKNKEFTDMIDEIGEAILNAQAKTLEEAMDADTNGIKVSELIVNKVAKIGEKLSLRRITYMEKNDNEVFGSYIHMGGKIAVLVRIEGGNVEVAKDVAMQAAAMRPNYVFVEDVPEDVLDNERKVLKEQAINSGKKPEIAEKMVEGGIKKYYQENCLVEQAFVKENKLSVKEYLAHNNAKLVSMVRYEVGEGMEHRNDNFAEEVMNQINN